MQQLGRTPLAIIVGLGLLAAGTTATAASVEILSTAPTDGQGLSGIRTRAPGAVRQDRPGLPEKAPVVSGQARSTRAAVGSKISATPMAGGVNVFALTPDGATAVYIADQDIAGRFELYSTPVDGSAAATKISAGLAFGVGDTGVSLFQIAAGGAQVVFLADPNLGGGMDDLYSVPIDGSLAPVRLNTAAQAPVTAVGLAPDGTTVAFFGNDTAFGGGATEVYKATVGSAASGVQLSDASATSASNVVAADFSADNLTLLYAADAGLPGVFQWHSVPFSAGGPGSDVLLTDALGSVSLGRISPDSTTLVYAADENLVGVQEIFQVPLGGGASMQLNPAMAGSGVRSLRINGDSTRVAYLADQATAGVVEVFGAQLGLPGSGMRLNMPLVGTQSADVLTMAPDNTNVLYEADENTVGTYDLLSVPIDGGGSSTTLDMMTPPSSAGFFPGLGTPIVANRAFYPVVGSVVDLYSVPWTGGQPSTRVNSMLAAGDTVSGAFVPNFATRLAAYGVGASGGITDRLFAAPIRADLAPEQVNVTAPGGSLGVIDYGITADEVYAVYIQDQDTAGTAELYAAELDSDQDSIPNGSDNCPFVDNMGQASVPFGQTINAFTKSIFNWNTAVDARYVRGPLATVAALVPDGSGTLVEASFFTDTDTPVAGAGFFYLFAVDCSGRSYQSVLGAEPGRDTAGLP